MSGTLEFRIETLDAAKHRRSGFRCESEALTDYLIDHPSFVTSMGLPQRLGNGSRRRQQGLDKAAGFFSVEPNHRLLGNQPVGGLQSVGNDECADRAAFDGCRSLEHSLVPLAHARHEPLTLSFRSGCAHERDVCLRGTHCKDKSDRLETEAAQSGERRHLPSPRPAGYRPCLPKNPERVTHTSLSRRSKARADGRPGFRAPV